MGGAVADGIAPKTTRLCEGRSRTKRWYPENISKSSEDTTPKSGEERPVGGALSYVHSPLGRDICGSEIGGGKEKLIGI